MFLLSTVVAGQAGYGAQEDGDSRPLPVRCCRLGKAAGPGMQRDGVPQAPGRQLVALRAVVSRRAGGDLRGTAAARPEGAGAGRSEYGSYLRAFALYLIVVSGLLRAVPAEHEVSRAARTCLVKEYAAAVAAPPAIVEPPAETAPPSAGASDLEAKDAGSPLQDHLEQPDPEPVPEDDLLERAHREDAWRWKTYQRPISAQTLRKRLRIGAARSRTLVAMVRADNGDRLSAAGGGPGAQRPVARDAADSGGGGEERLRAASRADR